MAADAGNTGIGGRSWRVHGRGCDSVTHCSGYKSLALPTAREKGDQTRSQRPGRCRKRHAKHLVVATEAAHSTEVVRHLCHTSCRNFAC